LKFWLIEHTTESYLAVRIVYLHDLGSINSVSGTFPNNLSR